MKTYNEFLLEIDEVLSFSARRAVGRRMKMMSKKASTKMKKKRNKMKALPQDKAHQKAQKAVRNLIKQKTVGKGKDLKAMSIGQKASLEKKVDKRMKAMGGKVHALVGRFQKKIIKKHRAAAAAARSKKQMKTFLEYIRDYKDEYKKFQSSPERIKYRSELVIFNRDKGTYGNGDKKDASHKGGKIVGFEDQSKNRGRAEASRLKKK